MLIQHGRLISGDVADVRVDRGIITEIGTGLTDPSSEVIDATGLVVAPGLVDAHRHVWQAPLRGLGADLTLLAYLDVVLGRALPVYTPSLVRLATLVGALEALDAGVTTLFDWSNATLTPAHTDAVVDAYEEAGGRAVVAHGNPDDVADVRRLAGRTGRVTGALAILGDYGPWDDAVAQVGLARELGLVVSLHARAATVRRLHGDGLLGPDLNLVHLNDITDDEAKLVVEAGAGVTVTPTVEALMGHGPSAFGRIADAGGHPALGVDVAVSAAPDLFEPLRDTLRTERTRTGTMVPAASVLRSATLDAARTAGLGDTVGAIDVGRRADLVLLDGLAPVTGDVAGAMVASLTPANVRTVLVDGHVVKRDGQLVSHDLPALRARAVAVARTVWPARTPR
jgi:cytosine/adenosine deaminase-related metal-dependent hydrolase